MDKDYIYISYSKDLKENYAITRLLKIEYNGMRKWNGKQSQMEIKYIPFIKKFYAYQTEKIEPRTFATEERTICSIDLAIKRYIKSYIKDSKDFCLIYDSRHIFLRLWKYYQKKK
ncbi:MAG: hypothetical protein R6U96_19265 [Promethearchaeia archaeon]